MRFFVFAYFSDESRVSKPPLLATSLSKYAIYMYKTDGSNLSQ